MCVHPIEISEQGKPDEYGRGADGSTHGFLELSVLTGRELT